MNLLEDEPGKTRAGNESRDSLSGRTRRSDGLRAPELRSEKKKRDSRAAFSSESEAWIAFRSFDSAKSWRTVPCSASFGSVAPIALRSAATASAFSSTSGMHGPEVMNVTSDP